MLTDKDFEDAALILGCEKAAIKAVCDVEAPKGGFNPDGTPITLFEGHKFYKYTNGRFAKDFPSVCYPTWTRKWYGKTWQEEEARLKLAMRLDPRAAKLSASWGRFQIMGFNYALCGYTAVDDFVVAMHESEASQLHAFCEYVIHTGLNDELKNHDWTEFARRYNGADFWANRYNLKLAVAYEREYGVKNA